MDSIKNNKAFLQMEPRKQEMVLLLIDSLNNKKLTEALPVLMQFREKMTQEGISFTEEENAMLTEIFTNRLSPAQKKQYEYLKHIHKKITIEHHISLLMKRQCSIKAIIDSHALKGNILLKQSLIAMH